ncbi:hypothetical protein B0H14DRAFT_3442485 [Mycena olivaceomarginata]|nr:hypothetical protein B0H14DRAFT_3442485 [Mycena olivaceomarginata]
MVPGHCYPGVVVFGSSTRTIQEWLRSFLLQSLLEAVIGHRDVVRIPGRVDVAGIPRVLRGMTRDPSPLADLWTLAIPRSVRQSCAEDIVLALSRPNPTHPAFAGAHAPHVAASDGSQGPAATMFRDPRFVTFATASPYGTIQGTLDLMGSLTNIGAGEVYGLIAATLLLSRNPILPRPFIRFPLSFHSHQRHFHRPS